LGDFRGRTLRAAPGYDQRAFGGSQALGGVANGVLIDRL